MSASQITITTKSRESVAAEQLGEFLFLFRGAYAAALDFAKRRKLKVFSPNSGSIDEFRRVLLSLTPDKLDPYFSAELRGSPLITKSIVQSSPIEMVVAGSVVALVLATIVSGGEVETPLSKFKLNKLGDGIKALRDAFGFGRLLNAGFGIRSTTIKLNKEECYELMKQDPTTRKDGGFQGFLVSLQGRVKRRTLELSEADIERIVRYKANPSKGGWQSRFKKIFGRHI